MTLRERQLWMRERARLTSSAAGPVKPGLRECLLREAAKIDAMLAWSFVVDARRMLVGRLTPHRSS